jgi:hypothetical protein
MVGRRLTAAPIARIRLSEEALDRAYRSDGFEVALDEEPTTDPGWRSESSVSGQEALALRDGARVVSSTPTTERRRCSRRRPATRSLVNSTEVAIRVA